MHVWKGNMQSQPAALRLRTKISSGVDQIVNFRIVSHIKSTCWQSAHWWGRLTGSTSAVRRRLCGHHFFVVPSQRFFDLTWFVVYICTWLKSKPINLLANTLRAAKMKTKYDNFPELYRPLVVSPRKSWWSSYLIHLLSADRACVTGYIAIALLLWHRHKNLTGKCDWQFPST